MHVSPQDKRYMHHNRLGGGGEDYESESNNRVCIYFSINHPVKNIIRVLEGSPLPTGMLKFFLPGYNSMCLIFVEASVYIHKNHQI